MSKGFDLQGEYQVTDALHLDLSLGYTDARYTANSFSADGTLLVANGDAVGGQPWIAPWTATLGVEYDFSAFSNDAYFRADDEYASHNGWPLATQHPQSESYDPALVADPATNQLSMRAGTIIGDWDIALFMNNALDAHPRLGLNHQDSATLLFEATTFRPRTTGFTLNYRW